MSVGWILVSFFTLLVAIAMAEIVSAIPTSGGPYFWAAMLAPPRWSPFAAWLTGWYNLLGQVPPLITHFPRPSAANIPRWR
jgi:amino acid transporter